MLLLCKTDLRVMEIADRLQRSFTKPWLGIQADLPRLQARAFAQGQPPTSTIHWPSQNRPKTPKS
jgi:hypothetical protein